MSLDLPCRHSDRGGACGHADDSGGCCSHQIGHVGAGLPLNPEYKNAQLTI